MCVVDASMSVQGSYELCTINQVDTRAGNSNWGYSLIMTRKFRGKQLTLLIDYPKV